MASHEDVYRTIASDYDSHLARVREFMAQPSASPEDLGVRECADLLMRYYRELGCQEVELAETPRYPSVWAVYNAGAPKTVAVYGYFDTNVVGSGWSHPPFDAVVAEHAPFPKVVYGRGAGNKGGYVAFLNALLAIKQVDGNLPVNFMFLTEGEEFMGSDHIPLLIDRYRDRLSQADAMFSPGPCQNASGDIALALGNKGCLHIELQCLGDHWGRGPSGGAVHSSNQGIVDHPVWRLVQALATMYDPKENRVTVPGFYDGLREPTPEDLELIDALADYYRGREGSAFGVADKVTTFANDATGRDVFLRYCFLPTMNINGLRAGYVGPGTTLWTLPHAAYCTIDHRLPPDLDPDVTCDKIRRHLDDQGYPDIQIKVLMSVGAQKLSVKDDLAQAALRVFENRGLQTVVWPRRGASGPTGYFSQMLGLKVLGSTGLGYASGHSTADEFLVIEGNGKVGGLVELEQSYVDLVYSYAAYPERA